MRHPGSMTAYRRLRLPGATYFFTVCLDQRGAGTLVENIGVLRQCYATTIRELPVTCHAMVILPDHMHAVWTEPEGEVFYSERWRRIKARFSHGLQSDFGPNRSQASKRERGLWQRRFWEHAVRNDDEFRAAITYCNQNPVKHRLVAEARNWPYSSYSVRGNGGNGEDGQIAHPTGGV